MSFSYITLTLSLVALLLTTNMACSSNETEPVKRTDVESYASPKPDKPLPTVAGISDEPPEPIVYEIIDAGPYSYGFTSLEYRVFESDIVAVAKLKSVQPSDNPFYSKGRDWIPDNWIPIIRYEFEVIEYLKGKAENPLHVYASFGSSGDFSGSSHSVYESKSDAVNAAHHYIAQDHNSLDERKAIIFLERESLFATQSNQETSDDINSYKFALSDLSGHETALEYRIDSKYNRVWLPAIDSENREEFILNTPGAADPFNEGATTTTDHLRNIISELEQSVQRAREQGIERYESCLIEKYERQRKNYGAIAKGGVLEHSMWRHYAPALDKHAIMYSGVSANKTSVGEVLTYTGDESITDFVPIWLTGRDGHLFGLQADPADTQTKLDTNSPRTFSLNVVPNRVLPSGSYQFRQHIQEGRFIACDYYDELSATDFFVEVIPREQGVLYEGFFDPVTTDSAVRTNHTYGTRQPKQLETDMVSVSIAEIAWRNQRVEVHLSEPEALRDYYIDFIRNDGTTVQILSFNTAEQRSSPYLGYRSLTWQLSEPPWNKDEDLIFRIRRDIPRVETDSPVIELLNPKCDVDDIGIVHLHEHYRIIDSKPSTLCPSTHRAPGYSRYHTFTLLQDMNVQISLESDCDALDLYVFKGSKIREEPIYTIRHNSTQSSRPDASDLLGILQLGTYTIEVNVPAQYTCEYYDLHIITRS